MELIKERINSLSFTLKNFGNYFVSDRISNPEINVKLTLAQYHIENKKK